MKMAGVIITVGITKDITKDITTNTTNEGEITEDVIDPMLRPTPDIASLAES